jgi:flagellar basal-body rod modification protein FlgD
MSANPLGILPASLTNSSSSSSALSSASGGLSSLTPSDFVNMMVKQLQNQDPLNPTNSQDLLAQISSIGQLQSSTQLTTTLQGLTTQNQIASGAALIGKQVSGLDSNSNSINGLVNSVSVTSTGINLQLDNGNTLPLANVTTIAPGPNGSTTATTGTKS